MADTKITALTAITTVDPAADVLPIVDVSDTSMAASGTTKKITSNQILGAGGTATLASATITGDLTVDTSTLKVDSANNRVGIGTASPSYTLDVTSSATTVIRSLASAGNQAYVSVAGNGGVVGASSLDLIQDGSSNSFIYNRANAYLVFGTNNTERLRIDSSGNVGIGVTPINRLTVAGNMAVGGTGNNGLQFHSGSPVSGNLVWWLTNDQANSNILNLYYYNAGVFSGRAFVVNQSGNFMVRTPSTPPTIPDNEMMVFNLTSNTNLRISVKGTDGTVRTANITLA